MLYINEKYVPADWIELAKENNATINVKFCNDCEYFDCDGIQPDHDIIHGRCMYLTPKPPYLRVKTTDFCNGDGMN